MQCAEILRVQAYFDGELDALSAVDVERHSQTCAECGALLQDLDRLRTALRQNFADTSASPALRSRIMLALDQEEAGRSAPVRGDQPRRWRPPPFWKGAFSGMGVTALAASVLFFSVAPPLVHPIIDDLVTAHVRSLMPDHLIDVISTDRHTVKPWFAGHADVSPVVADFDGQGYRLIGGRADYFDRHRAAVVVYRHGSHVINVFSWAADQRDLPKNTTLNGYHLAFWKVGNLIYCAVSDSAWDELLGLAKLLQDAGARDAR